MMMAFVRLPHTYFGTVKSVWFRQVLGLLRVLLRQVYSGIGLDRFTQD
jgi:hypothetical protein